MRAANRLIVEIDLVFVRMVESDLFQSRGMEVDVVQCRDRN